MKRTVISLLLGLSSMAASAVPLTFTNEGVIGQTTLFRGALGGLGLTQIASISISDSNSGLGGSPGVFSGFDLDFAILDLDGDFSTVGDHVFASVSVFTTGAIRATASPDFQPSAGRPGPTFGSSAANVIDVALSTLNVLDGSFPGSFNTDNVSGWLTLGDGGVLKLGFASPIVLTGTEALFLGEVGTGAGEQPDGATVNVSNVPIPEPSALALIGAGLVGFGCMRRKAKHA